MISCLYLHVYCVFVISIVPVVTIVSNPAGTPVSGSTNTFDYPILSNVTLTCMVTSSDGGSTVFVVTRYQWNTTRCFTNNAHNTPTCFPTGQTTQSVTGNNLLAEDAGTITCTVTIGGVYYTSGPLTLRISGNAFECACKSDIYMNCISFLFLANFVGLNMYTHSVFFFIHLEIFMTV